MTLFFETIFLSLNYLLKSTIFLIYLFSILISIMGDIKIDLSIDDRLSENEKEFTSNYKNYKSKVKEFIIGIGIILFLLLVNLKFELINNVKNLSITLGIIILSIIYILGHKICERQIENDFLTKKSFIETKYTSEVDLIHFILSPLKALLYILMGIIYILRKR